MTILCGKLKNEDIFEIKREPRGKGVISLCWGIQGRLPGRGDIKVEFYQMTLDTLGK